MAIPPVVDKSAATLSLEQPQKPTSKEQDILALHKEGADLWGVKLPFYGPAVQREKAKQGGAEGARPEILSGQEAICTLIKTLPGVQKAVYSSCGSLLCLVTTTKLTILAAAEGHYEDVCSIDIPQKVASLSFSPKATFVLARFANNAFRIWKSVNGDLAFGSNDRVSAQGDNSLQWTSNEDFCAILVNKAQIWVYEGHFPSGVETRNKWIVKGNSIASFAIQNTSEGGAATVAVFETPKGKPASTNIFRIEHSSESVSLLMTATSFYAQQGELFFNFSGTSLLVHASSDVDSTKKSYYGRSCLDLVNCVARTSRRVVTAEAGPVHDIKWSPTEDLFVCIRGPMPPQATLHDGKTGEAILNMESNQRNFIQWNSFGKLVLLAGFGNLAGSYDIWDKQKKRILHSGKAEWTVVCAWAPDGRNLLFATCAPRMRTDNGFKIVSYDGSVLFKKEYSELYHCIWKPMPGAFASHAPTIPQAMTKASLEGNKPKLYRPPMQRNNPGKSGPTSQVPGAPRVIPGYTPTPAPKRKSKK